jgi:hypothetical protein
MGDGPNARDRQMRLRPVFGLDREGVERLTNGIQSALRVRAAALGSGRRYRRDTDAGRSSVLA